ncbi:TlpA disulfide reductase family protein [Pedobacter sp. MC2016-24]|uniref:TlpA family protein disulfide reductase n=1 Tax=Pedobacter sp. MC2016-24 TaxID=2780090 RepID=UPI00187F6E77|nr:TlpA disulfide reductase family protein [Pedobacter sp. MC2016-24]MBE9599946.1 TlpA family protein disulfide reductase [Pedobacter sp. MC2016-24]
MKKIFIIIINVVLCAAFALKGHAQNSLSVGQKMPDLTLPDIINYKTPTLKFSDFRGKVVILDFWATWCSPCIAMIPKIEALQNQFDGKVQFLSVGYESTNHIVEFLKKLEKQTGKNVTLPQITNDKILVKLFPHQTLPHCVWIGADGTVQAISDPSDVNEENIRKILTTKSLQVRTKQETNRTYDALRPLFFGESNDNNLLLRSQLSGYIDGLGRGIYKDVQTKLPQNLKRITARNLSMTELFRLAYRKEQKEMIIEVKDLAALEPDKNSIKNSMEFMDWVKNGNGYCYELQLPESRSKDAFMIMQSQLQTYFPKYKIGLEHRKVKCLALIRTTTDDKILTKGGEPMVNLDKFGCNFRSCFLSVFIDRLQIPLQSSPLPVIDATNYKNMVDIKLDCNMTDLKELNEALIPYGLRFDEIFSDLEMVVIKDNAGI